MFKEDVLNLLKINLNEKQIAQFELYYQYLIEYNQITNLTRITEKDEVYYKHFYDSITLVQSISMLNVNSICDMGAGAGFPSIPLKIIFPHLKITIIDSLGKRIAFLKNLIELLKLENVSLIYDRIENHAHKSTESYDVVTARALGKLSLILELGIPMLKKHGQFIAYKSSNYDEELNQATHAIRILGAKFIKAVPIKLPNNYGNRVHIVIEKIKESPKEYPRSFSAIKKRNL